MSRSIYAQVLLLDNKIEAWKVCSTKKDSPYDFYAYWKLDKMEHYTMETKEFKSEDINIEPWNFNSYIYDVLAPQWINEWEYALDYKGRKARVEKLNK